MAMVFISFLGIGRKGQSPGYDLANYQAPGGVVYQSRFSQSAVLQHLGAERFDRVALLVTPESLEKNWSSLRDELISLGIVEDRIVELARLDANSQDPASQWAWFAKVLSAINDDDDVVFDFTHGFRSVPIVLSSAIGFLQKAKRFNLIHAFYGFMIPGMSPATVSLVDLAPFYEINQWADAVGALVSSADTGPLVRLSQDVETSGFPALADKDLSDALSSLTHAVKDVQMNQVASKAAEALRIVSSKLDDPDLTAPERLLLGLVVEKFAKLGERTGTGRYDRAYFEVQVVLMGMLVEHGMHMQAYTVMREVVASIGMLGAKAKYRNAVRDSDSGRRGRRWGELFANMSQFKRAEWKWEKDSPPQPSEEQKRFSKLKEWWADLERLGLAQPLHELARESFKIRNDLSHGWTSAGEERRDVNVREKADDHVQRMKTIVQRLIDEGLTVA